MYRTTVTLLLTLLIFLYSCESMDTSFRLKKSEFESLPAGELVCPETRLDTNKKVVALTFDACGGRGSSGYDAELISYLREQNIKATLFLNVRWIEKNFDAFTDLINDPLFQIENHGLRHKPATVNGACVYGIRGTRNIDQLIEEVELSAQLFEKYGAKKPKYFRSGTAWYDTASIKIIGSSGIMVVK
ncbi:MAG: polysaccharide deacetylase family protein [Spirochaetes bacterium]|jgi:peptidoglycan/xylan/chitin deacetylase (PgdA/CDA1 family)|nr:polysaccharide deacetylase family protein [Spirochaetota bacterium]